jgi:nucleoside-diphosphate-sugar epimerase
MKRILITGTDSYIGKYFDTWISEYAGKYVIDKISIRDENWKKVNFSNYDVVIHLAAIVHKKEQPETEKTYYKVNRDLTVEIAKTVKAAGVKQFIFMSTMAVYGEIGDIGKDTVITKDTIPSPNTFYGKSKLEAEYALNKLKMDNFKLVILRPPMIYGSNCPGNYARLEKLSKKILFFPFIDNKRSMLHIDRLCEYLKSYIDDEVEGIFFPQDDTYVNTSILVKNLAEKNGKKIYMSKSLGMLIKLLGNRVKLIKKIFGNLIYEK